MSDNLQSGSYNDIRQNTQGVESARVESLSLAANSNRNVYRNVKDHGQSFGRSGYKKVADNSGSSTSGGGMPPISPDLISYRLDKNESAVTALESRTQSIEATVNRIETKLDGLATRTEIASLPSKDTIRNWNIALIAVIVGGLISIGTLFIASAANQLSAFSVGLSAVQAVVAVKPPSPSP